MRRLWLLPAVAGVLSAGCIHAKVEPIEVKPIHITMDVNVKVQKVDKQLDDFFNFEQGQGRNGAETGTKGETK